MDKKQAARIKNILEGNYNGNTSLQIGYDRSVTHKEGDEWEEDDKKWTIKDGIKCSRNNYTDLRRKMQTPLFCPNCKNIMNHHLDEKFWRLNDMCYDCSIKHDTQLILEGTFEEYSNDRVKKNITAYLDAREIELLEYIDDINAKQYITERGDIEDWTNGLSDDTVKSNILDSFNTMKQQLLDSISPDPIDCNKPLK
jgi:hypothetical protein